MGFNLIGEKLFHFTRAVSVGNPREFLEAEKEDQEIAEACKRIIKNCIICWNYLYLSQKLEEIENAAQPGGVSRCGGPWLVAWRHVNLLGEYDFSEEKLRDSVGIRLPKLAGSMGPIFRGSKNKATVTPTGT